MIVTVTPNPAVDRTVLIHGFTIGGTNRIVGDRTDIGGKGINVARHLARLGCDVLATGFLGMRDHHGVVEALTAQGVRTEFVRIAGETRVNLKILDPTTLQETEINESGPPLEATAVDALLERISELARHCAVMVFSGSLPPGTPEDLYARGISLAGSAGVKTVLDTAGAPLRLGIAARPDLVKPNRMETEELLGTSLHGDGDVAAAARALVEYGAGAGVISLGSGGAVGATADGVWRSRAPEILPRNTVGAGDAMVAALAWALMRSLPVPEALRLATALGSAAAASDAALPPAGRFEMLVSDVLVEPVTSSETPYDAAGIGS